MLCLDYITINWSFYHRRSHLWRIQIPKITTGTQQDPMVPLIPGSTPIFGSPTKCNGSSLSHSVSSHKDTMICLQTNWPSSHTGIFPQCWQGGDNKCEFPSFLPSIYLSICVGSFLIFSCVSVLTCCIMAVSVNKSVYMSLVHSKVMSRLETPEDSHKKLLLAIHSICKSFLS